MRAALLCLVAAGCASDPCDAFPDESCIALEVRGPGLAVDQIGVSAAGFLLSDGRSPTVPRALKLPLTVAVLPGGKFAGSFTLTVRGFLGAESSEQEFGLRATYVFEHSPEFGWQIVQGHVSSPVSEAIIKQAVFGAAESPHRRP